MARSQGARESESLPDRTDIQDHTGAASAGVYYASRTVRTGPQYAVGNRCLREHGGVDGLPMTHGAEDAIDCVPAIGRRGVHGRSHGPGGQNHPCLVRPQRRLLERPVQDRPAPGDPGPVRPRVIDIDATDLARPTMGPRVRYERGDADSDRVGHILVGHDSQATAASVVAFPMRTASASGIEPLTQAPALSRALLKVPGYQSAEAVRGEA